MTAEALTKFLLRLGVKPLRGPTWDRAAQQQHVFTAYLHSLEEIEERTTRIEREIEVCTQASVHAPTVAALQAMRGVNLVTAGQDQLT